MHHLVLEHREDALAAAEHRVAIALDRAGLEDRENRAVGAAGVSLDLVTSGPAVRGVLVGRLPIAGVDTAREQSLEIVVQPRVVEALLEETVHGEGRYVPLVEHDRMTQGNRALVIRVVIEDVEQRPCALPVAEIGLDDRLTVDDRSICRTAGAHRTPWTKTRRAGFRTLAS